MARDKIHELVKLALIKEKWEITHDPYEIRYLDLELRADLAAQRPLGAQKGNEKIAVEIKSFLNRSPIQDLKLALGQYLIYRTFIDRTEPDRDLYLAISNHIYEKLFSREAIEVTRQEYKMKLVVIDLAKQEIEKWIK